MGIKTLNSAAQAAGYAMAADDISEPRLEAVRIPSTAVIVRPVVHRSLVASTHRTLRRLWLQWFVAPWAHRAAI